MTVLPEYWYWEDGVSMLYTGNVGNCTDEAHWPIGEQSFVLCVRDPLTEDSWPFTPIDLDFIRVTSAAGEYRESI